MLLEVGSERASRKSLLNDLRVAFKEPPGFPPCKVLVSQHVRPWAARSNQPSATNECFARCCPSRPQGILLVPLRRFLSLGTPITLRQGARVIEDSRRLRLAWSDIGAHRRALRCCAAPTVASSRKSGLGFQKEKPRRGGAEFLRNQVASALHCALTAMPRRRLRRRKGG